MFSGTLGRLAAPGAAILVALGLAWPSESRTTAHEPEQIQQASRLGPARLTPARLTPAQFANRLVFRTNLRREAVDCPPLRVHPALTLAAVRHTVRMADRQQMSHQLVGEPSLRTRVENAGYQGWRHIAENIAWAGGSSPDRIFMLWINSPGHRRHIQDCDLRDIGIGVRYAGGRTWATQDFGRR